MTSSSPSGKTDMKAVTVRAPGTVANIVCGYDVLGLALHNPFDEVTVTLNDTGNVTLTIDGDGGMLPLDTASNVASAVIIRFLEHTSQTQKGAHVHLQKQMPLNSGMGSSSASSVAALVAINHLTGNRFSRKELLPFATEGERIACGNAHADNVAPALLGGVVLVRSHDPLDVKKLPCPEHLQVAVVHPHIDVPTRESRKILKNRIPLPEAVTQWGNVAGLVAGFCTKDTALIGRSMVDVIFEPVRSMLIPGFYDMKQISKECGALGFGISGSGPSVFALCESRETAAAVTSRLAEFLNKAGIDTDAFVSSINMNGAEILSEA